MKDRLKKKEWIDGRREEGKERKKKGREKE